METPNHMVSFRTDKDVWSLFKSLCSLEGKTITTQINSFLHEYNSTQSRKMLKHNPSTRGDTLGSQGRQT